MHSRHHNQLWSRGLSSAKMAQQKSWLMNLSYFHLGLQFSPSSDRALRPQNKCTSLSDFILSSRRHYFWHFVTDETVTLSVNSETLKLSTT